MRVFAQVYNFTTTAITIPNAISECFAMKEVVVLERKHLERDALKMKLVEERECVYSRPLFPLTELANRYCLNQIIVWFFPCTKQTWLKSIRIYSSIKVTLKRSADLGS